MATEIGPFIKRCRKKEKLSGIELSKEIGVSSAYISQIETGRIKLPSQNIMIKLARHLNIPMQKMMQITGYSLEDSVIEEETAKQREIKSERKKRKAKEKRVYIKKLRADHDKADVIRKEKLAQEKERLEQKRQLKKEERNQQKDEQANQQAIETGGAELPMEAKGKEEVVMPTTPATPTKSLISMHPLEVLLSLETATLADLFLTHMRKGKIIYHTYLVHALTKGADGNGSSSEIIDLMIANHHELLHIDVFQSAIVRYAVQNGTNADDPVTGAIKNIQDVEAQPLFPLWEKAYFSDNVLRDYGDYELSSHKVDTFELEPLLKSHMVLLNGRIVNPNVVRTIKALLMETTNSK